MSTERKFLPGAVIRTMCDLLGRLDRAEYVFVRHKPQHPSWLSSLQLNHLRGLVFSRALRTADLNPLWRARVVERMR